MSDQFEAYINERISIPEDYKNYVLEDYKKIL